MKNWMKIGGLLLLVTCSTSMWGATIAYDVPLQPGNQAFPFALGMDFNVNSAIRVSSLGVFASNGSALATPLTASIYDRTTQTAVATLVFAPGPTGTLINGSRFLNLAMPLVLSAGFQGRIVAEGYGPTNLDGSPSLLPPFTGPTLNSGGGLISFVGNSPYGVSPGMYPNTPNLFVAQYGAGTFAFDPVIAAVPEPGSFVLLATALTMFLGFAWQKRRVLKTQR